MDMTPKLVELFQEVAQNRRTAVGIAEREFINILGGNKDPALLQDLRVTLALSSAAEDFVASIEAGRPITTRKDVVELLTKHLANTGVRLSVR